MQTALFADWGTEPEQVQPRGFRYQDGILTEEEQARLTESLGYLEVQPFEFHGYVGNRRVVSFGLNYDFSRRSLDRGNDMPPFLNDLLRRAADFAGLQINQIRQVGINEYRPGAGIGWHKDKREFGTVVGVSLAGSATMRFRRAAGAGWKRVSHQLKPRSIYVLEGEARTEWEHSMPAVQELRYSINFRTLAKGVGEPA